MANKQWVAGPQEGWGWTVREQGGKREKKYMGITYLIPLEK